MQIQTLLELKPVLHPLQPSHQGNIEDKFDDDESDCISGVDISEISEHFEQKILPNNHINNECTNSIIENNECTDSIKADVQNNCSNNISETVEENVEEQKKTDPKKRKLKKDDTEQPLYPCEECTLCFTTVCDLKVST